MARVTAGLLASALMLALHSAAAAAPVVFEPWVVVDDDDDDFDGTPDGQSSRPADLVDCESYETSALPAGLVLNAIAPLAAARVFSDGVQVEPGHAIPAAAKRISVQALAAGLITVDLGSALVRVRAVRIHAVDGDGKLVGLASSHASFQRSAPDRMGSPLHKSQDPDALRFVLEGRPQDLPTSVKIVSRSEKRALLGTLPEARLNDVACPSPTAAGVACRTTAPVRVVGDEVDRSHPLVSDRSIRGELGGGLLIDVGGGRGQQIRIGGPRNTRMGPIRRYRASLRARLMRVASKGAPALGTPSQSGEAMVREQIGLANALWGQCGISFGPPEEADIATVDPPAAMMIGVGCDLGMPASGGEIRLQVEGRRVVIGMRAGQSPSQVARAVERELVKAGYRAVVSPNARIGPGALPTVDVLVRRKDGAPATVLGPAHGPVSTDATLGVCVGRGDLSAGLHHFFDVDSMAGTFQERLLLKSVDDRDPSTIDLLVIAAFARGGRIGESFIGNDRSSLRNIVVIDRAGIRVAMASFTLAHEVGHVLLDVPGHPDDYGIDTPSLLMDSDGADLSAFGPRRLTIAECERALVQSGPQTAMPVLRPWAWGRMSKGN